MTQPQTRALTYGILAIAILAVISLSIGVFSLSFRDLLSRDARLESSQDSLVFVVSRIPRTVAIMLVGASMGVAGMIMQMLSRNKFVSPSTAGTIESASLGILLVTMWFPNSALVFKMLFAIGCALVGTALFMIILRAVPLRSPLVVPLIGIMLGAVIASVTTFLAYRYDFLQSLAIWTNGDFARVLRGRYEMLWLSGGLTVLAYIAADRFTVAGIGETYAKNVGLNYRAVLVLGLSIVSVVTAINVVTVGAIPFLGLIVPNVVSLIMGDNVRRAIPWIALFGMGFVLTCDILGRILRYPYEIPIGTVVGVVGSIIFLYLLLRKPSYGN